MAIKKAVHNLTIIVFVVQFLHVDQKDFSISVRATSLAVVSNCWTELWTGSLDWIAGLDCWTGSLDWIAGLDCWAGS